MAELMVGKKVPKLVGMMADLKELHLVERTVVQLVVMMATLQVEKKDKNKVELRVELRGERRVE